MLNFLSFYLVKFIVCFSINASQALTTVPEIVEVDAFPIIICTYHFRRFIFILRFRFCVSILLFVLNYSINRYEM
jgi:hypothetical protein